MKPGIVKKRSNLIKNRYRSAIRHRSHFSTMAWRFYVQAMTACLGTDLLLSLIILPLFFQSISESIVRQIIVFCNIQGMLEKGMAVFPISGLHP